MRIYVYCNMDRRCCNPLLYRDIVLYQICIDLLSVLYRFIIRAV